MAEAVLIHAEHDHALFLFDALLDRRAERAGHGAFDMGAVGEQPGQVEDAELVVEREHAAGDHRHFQRAEADAVDKRLLLAELAVGVEFEGEVLREFLADPVGEHLRRRIERRGLGYVAGDAHVLRCGWRQAGECDCRSQGE